MSLQPALVQALPVGLSPLAQLTGITPERATEMEIVHKAEGKRWLDKWYKADVEGVTEAKNMAKYWPKLDIVSAEFKGESYSFCLTHLVIELIISRWRKGRHTLGNCSVDLQMPIHLPFHPCLEGATKWSPHRWSQRSCRIRGNKGRVLGREARSERSRRGRQRRSSRKGRESRRHKRQRRYQARIPRQRICTCPTLAFGKFSPATCT